MSPVQLAREVHEYLLRRIQEEYGERAGTPGPKDYVARVSRLLCRRFEYQHVGEAFISWTVPYAYEEDEPERLSEMEHLTKTINTMRRQASFWSRWFT